MSRELVVRAQHGDREAFAILAGAQLGRLVGTASLVLHGSASADDAAQETLVRAWRDLRRLRDPDRFGPWLHRLLIRACQDQLRRTRHEIPAGELIVERGGMTDPTASFGERDEIDRGLRRLTDDQRIVVVLRYYADLSEADIAQALGVPRGTVKSRLHRALSSLRAELAAEARPALIEERLT
jgi:RNA polymerase sigma-70 factor (ECF subfamily)